MFHFQDCHFPERYQILQQIRGKIKDKALKFPIVSFFKIDPSSPLRIIFKKFSTSFSTSRLFSDK